MGGRPHAVQMAEYFDELVRRCEDDDVQPSKVNANMLAHMGGSRARREQAVEVFTSTFIDEDGQLIDVPEEVTNWIDEMTMKLLDVKSIALGSARFQASQMLADTRQKLADKTQEHVETSENLLKKVEENDELQLKVTELEKQLVEAKQREEALNGKITSKESELNQKQSQLSEAESQNRYIALQLESEQQKVQQLEGQLESERSLGLSYKDSLEELRGRNTELKGSYDEMVAKLTRTETDLGAVRDQLTEVRDQLHLSQNAEVELKNKNANLDTALLAKTAEYEDLQERSLKAAQTAETALSEVQAKLTEQTAKLELKEKELVDVRGQLRVEEANVETLKGLIEPLKLKGELDQSDK